MKMLVFYRSREYTNAIVSSAKAKLQGNKVIVGLDVDFVNLDKRNYVKVLSQLGELPKFIYIWYDEEKITDYINDNYSSIEVIHFNPNSSIIGGYNAGLGCYTKDYKLDKILIDKFKENLEKREVYTVEKYKNYKITKEQLDDLDCANRRNSSGWKIFNTIEEAKMFSRDSLIHDVEQSEDYIENLSKQIQTARKKLTAQKNLLKKFLPKTD